MQSDPRFQLVYQDALAAVFVRSASPCKKQILTYRVRVKRRSTWTIQLFR